MIRSFRGRPGLGEGAYVDASAQVIGGVSLGERASIGMGATLLNGVAVGEGTIVGAGSLLPERMSVPPGRVVMGVPARVLRETMAEERERIRESAEHYVDLKETYRRESGKGEVG